MSMHKAIKSGKEHRKEWEDKGSYCKSVDTHCQNHGGRYKSWECPYCKSNRLHKFKKEEEKSKSKLKEVIDTDNHCGTWKLYIKNTKDKWVEVSVAED